MQHRIAVSFTASVALCGLLFAASPAQAAELAQTESVAGATVSPATVSPATSAAPTPDVVAEAPATSSLPVPTPRSDAAPQEQRPTSGTTGQTDEAPGSNPGGTGTSTGEGGVSSSPAPAGIGGGGATTPPATTPPPVDPTTPPPVEPSATPVDPSAPPIEPSVPPVDSTPPLVENGGTEDPGGSPTPGGPTPDPGTSETPAQPAVPEKSDPPTPQPTPQDIQPDGETTQGPAGGEEPPADDAQTPVDDTVDTVEMPEGFEDWTDDEKYDWFAEQVAQLIDENWDELQNSDDFQRVVGLIEAFLLDGDVDGLEAFLLEEFGEDYGFGVGIADWVLAGLVEDGILGEDEVQEVIDLTPAGPEAPGTKPGSPEGFETPPALVPVGPAADVVAAGNVDGAADASPDSRSRQLAVTGTDAVVRAGAAGLALLVAGGLLIRLGARRHRTG